MRIAYKLMIAGAAMLSVSVNAYSWGQKGHDVVCAIAEQHLTDKARKRIGEIFEGKSLVYWCNWMDNASHQPDYRYSKTWHYANVDPNEDYDKVVKGKSGYVVYAIETQIGYLKKDSLDKVREAISLRMLIHMMGDLHAPMHMGHKSDRGGNKVQVQYFGNGTNLHKIWDSAIMNTVHSWSYTEWRNQIDITDEKRIAEIVAGDPCEWGRETYKISSSIYAETPAGSKLSFDYAYKWAPLIEDQLLKGGLRLAAVLNEIYK